MDNEKKKFNATAYKNEFNAKNYDKINLTVKKGGKDIISKLAAQNGMSVNAYIRKAISALIQVETGVETEL